MVSRVDIDARLYVQIVPLDSPGAPTPHPVRQARLDPEQIYKVLGMYNPSETSEAYFILANDDREIWFISNRHLRVAGLFDGDALSLPLTRMRQSNGLKAEPMTV